MDLYDILSGIGLRGLHQHQEDLIYWIAIGGIDDLPIMEIMGGKPC
jgi:hypothetical protein